MSHLAPRKDNMKRIAYVLILALAVNLLILPAPALAWPGTVEPTKPADTPLPPTETIQPPTPTDYITAWPDTETPGPSATATGTVEPDPEPPQLTKTLPVTGWEDIGNFPYQMAGGAILMGIFIMAGIIRRNRDR